MPVAERGQINKDGSPESRQISGVRDCAVPWRRVVFEFRARFRPSSVRCIFTLPFLKSTAIPRVFSFLFSHRLSLHFSLRYISLINNRSHSFNSQLPTSLYNTHTFTQCTLPPSSRLSSLPSPSPTPLGSSLLTRTLSGSLTALRLLSGPLSTLTPGTFLFS